MHITIHLCTPKHLRLCIYVPICICTNALPHSWRTTPRHTYRDISTYAPLQTCKLVTLYCGDLFCNVKLTTLVLIWINKTSAGVIVAKDIECNPQIFLGSCLLPPVVMLSVIISVCKLDKMDYTGFLKHKYVLALIILSRVESTASIFHMW